MAVVRVCCDRYGYVRPDVAAGRGKPIVALADFDPKFAPEVGLTVDPGGDVVVAYRHEGWKLHRLQNAPTAKYTARAWSTVTGEQLWQRTDVHHRLLARADGTFLAMGPMYDAVLDAATGTELLIAPSVAALRAAVGPPGTPCCDHVAVWSYRSDDVLLLDPELEVVWRTRLPGSLRCSLCEFAPDGRRLFLYTEQRVFEVDTETGCVISSVAATRDSHWIYKRCTPCDAEVQPRRTRRWDMSAARFAELELTEVLSALAAVDELPAAADVELPVAANAELPLVRTVFAAFVAEDARLTVRATAAAKISIHTKR